MEGIGEVELYRRRFARCEVLRRERRGEQQAAQ